MNYFFALLIAVLVVLFAASARYFWNISTKICVKKADGSSSFADPGLALEEARRFFSRLRDDYLYLDCIDKRENALLIYSGALQLEFNGRDALIARLATAVRDLLKEPEFASLQRE